VTDTTGLSEALRDAIRATGLSLEVVSRRCGITERQMDGFMRGERRMSVETMAKVVLTLKLRLVEAGGD
jgi:transcriptional regulator with XRE-family HTH domain